MGTGAGVGVTLWGADGSSSRVNIGSAMLAKGCATGRLACSQPSAAQCNTSATQSASDIGSNSGRGERGERGERGDRAGRGEGVVIHPSAAGTA